MKSRPWKAGSSLVASAAINGLLCTVLGVLLGGLRGGQLGLAAGVVLAVLPIVARISAAWLARPDGLPRLVAREIGAVVIRTAAAIAEALARLFGPVARLLQGPVLLLRFVAFVLAGHMAAILGAAGRTLATPLGLANLGALAVIAVNLAGVEFATPAVLIGLVLLILVLLVSENEAAGQDATPTRTNDHGAPL